MTSPHSNAASTTVQHCTLLALATARSCHACITQFLCPCVGTELAYNRGLTVPNDENKAPPQLMARQQATRTHVSVASTSPNATEMHARTEIQLFRLLYMHENQSDMDCLPHGSTYTKTFSVTHLKRCRQQPRTPPVPYLVMLPQKFKIQIELFYLRSLLVPSRPLITYSESRFSPLDSARQR